MTATIALKLCLIFCFVSLNTGQMLIATTWLIGVNTTDMAWELIEDGSTQMDAVEQAISESCELNWCSNSVGPYHKVDEQGDVTLDAMMIDGTTMEMGAVGGLRHVRAAISVARSVMKYTKHTLLVGEEASNFARDMGFPIEDLRTNETEKEWDDWKENNCQPNYRKNTTPDSETSCGPYAPNPDMNRENMSPSPSVPEEPDHDTICQIAIDDQGEVVVGTSTNGLKHKVAGRVGDTPIPGAGGYGVTGIGAAIATGNGDIMMRFLPSYQAVEGMRQGLSVREAVRQTVVRMNETFGHVPNVDGAVIGANVDGDYALACFGFTAVEYAVRDQSMEKAKLLIVNCEESMAPEEVEEEEEEVTDTATSHYISVYVVTCALVIILLHVL